MKKVKFAMFCYIKENCIFETRNYEFTKWGKIINITSDLVTFQLYWKV